MTGSIDLLASVKIKVEKLINHCEQLSASNSQMQSRLSQLESEKDQGQQVIHHLHLELDRRQAEIAELYQRVELLKNAEALSQSDERSAEVKGKINDLMREIDNCISLLSK